MFYYPQIVENGGLKSEGGENEPTMTLRLTSTPRPQEIQVVGERFRREASTVLRPGIRSGAEASSPTGDSGCLGIAGRRRLMNLQTWRRPSTDDAPTIYHVYNIEYSILQI